ncbi:MAG: hypothetical protein WC915_06600 [archaeon]|jgi:hypothetical protein
MKLWDYTKYYLAKIGFHLEADIFFNNQDKYSFEQRTNSLREIDLKLKKISGLAVKLGIIDLQKEIDFRDEIYKKAEKTYTCKPTLKRS